MGERIKYLRKELELTQQEFADRIGVKRTAIANYELGRNTPVDSVLVLICREFNVNEAWLRSGEGEMFIPEDRMSQIAKLTRDILSEESDSFKNRLIVALSKLNVEQWEALEVLADELNNKKD